MPTRAAVKQGIGEGENSYTVKTYAIVEITHQPVHANTPLLAIETALLATNYSKTLRQLSPSRQIKSIEHDGFDGAVAYRYKEIGGWNVAAEEVEEIDSEMIEQLLKL